ncbi:MAG TPA: fibronectin type III domain-containing protein, partial [Candidatus Saccharimonadales bacterium]|nr:fibronectin type III domain-containing protein [Candidatus Saccharimonadales bacterium]
FSVQSGAGWFAPTMIGSPTLTQSVSLVTDSDGTAQIYYKQPPLGGVQSTIIASSSGAQATLTSQCVGPATLLATSTFNYVGELSQSYTVPAGANLVIVKAWGGGGGACPDFDNPVNVPPGNSYTLAGQGGNGGSGGFASAVLNVSPGDQFTVSVGGGGESPIAGGNTLTNGFAGLGGWPGGGGGTHGSAGGGGYTHVQTPYGDVWVGGGGGAANAGAGGDAATLAGGNSGTATWSDSSQGDLTPGGGGRLTSGGTAGDPGGIAGVSGLGGGSSGGGGGGGWFGGGSGGQRGDWDTSDKYNGYTMFAGGGAGSSNITGSAYSSVMSVGSGTVTSDPYYPGSNVAIGGTNGGSGGDGAVVVLAYQLPSVNPVTMLTNVGQQAYTVPANTSYVTIKAWGSGGNGTTAADGGAGAYVTANYDVTPGQTVTAIVRGPGGRTDVILPNGTSIYAGGGGGAGHGTGGYGGAGGAPNGQPGGTLTNAAGGSGGSISGSGNSIVGAGGVGGTGAAANGSAGGASPSGTGGSGGWVNGYGTLGGQGGQGWGGGGGGGADANAQSGGGGGGGASAIVTGTQAPTTSQMVTTIGSAAADSSDPFYPGGNVGAGGINDWQGGNGAVVIIACTYAPVVTSATSVSLVQNQSANYTITGSYGATSFSATNLPPGLAINPTTGQISGSIAAPGTYSSTISATNRGGTGQTTLTWTVVADTFPPSTPTGLVAANVSKGSFTLSWAASTDNAAVASYQVQSNGVTVGTTASTSLLITGVTPGATYSLSVRASDAAGNWSTWSTPFNLTVSSDITAPSVVTGLFSPTVSATSTTIAWLPSTDNVAVTGYVIYRDGQQIATTTEPIFVDTGLSAGTSHAYTVTAFDGAGNASSSSANLTVTTAADFTGDADHDGIPDAVEQVVFPLGHGTVSPDQTNTLQLNIQQPVR